MRRACGWLLRIFGGLAGIAVVAVALFLAWLNLTSVSAADLPPLKQGDIVFQFSGSGQSLPILLASRSLYTHMGVIQIDLDGEAVVIEASSPVKKTPLDKWIVRGQGGRITVKRLPALTGAQQAAIIESAEHYLGLPYDIFFLDGTDAIYCSELVWLAFQQGADIRLGIRQRVSELDLDYAAVRSLIEQRWQKHPMCKDGRQPDFQSCYAVILDQRLITPVSIARDSRLKLVFSNFGAAAE